MFNFILIAGSYTPFSLCTLREYNSATGWTIFGVVWGLAILGIVFNSIDLKNIKFFYDMLYFNGMVYYDTNTPIASITNF